jgi:putative endonuclease
MTRKSKKLGNKGEDLACVYLQSNGLEIIERNHRNKIGEIDIIAKDGDIFVFVEVKSKTGRKSGLPEEMVNYYKQKKLINTAESYFLENQIDDPEWRIDVVAVNFDNSLNYKINWVKNAVEG